jgi:hypothetical protein
MSAPPYYYNYNAAAAATAAAAAAAATPSVVGGGGNVVGAARVKRCKKDPDAPKRPMSAFLDYSKTFRSEVIRNNPHVTDNKEISKILGALWRGASDAERQPFVEKELQARSEYKETIAQWRKRRNQEKKHEPPASKPPPAPQQQQQQPQPQLPKPQPRPQKSSKIHSGSSSKHPGAVVSSFTAAGGNYTSSYAAPSEVRPPPVNEPVAVASRDPNANYYDHPGPWEGHNYGIVEPFEPMGVPQYSGTNNWSMEPASTMYSPVNVNADLPQDARYDYSRHYTMPTGLYPSQPYYFPETNPNNNNNMFSSTTAANDQQYIHDAYNLHQQHRTRR